MYMCKHVNKNCKRIMFIAYYIFIHFYIVYIISPMCIKIPEILALNYRELVDLPPAFSIETIHLSYNYLLLLVTNIAFLYFMFICTNKVCIDLFMYTDTHTYTYIFYRCYAFVSVYFINYLVNKRVREGIRTWADNGVTMAFSVFP